MGFEIFTQIFLDPHAKSSINHAENSPEILEQIIKFPKLSQQPILGTYEQLEIKSIVPDKIFLTCKNKWDISKRNLTK